MGISIATQRMGSDY